MRPSPLAPALRSGSSTRHPITTDNLLGVDSPRGTPRSVKSVTLIPALVAHTVRRAHTVRLAQQSSSLGSSPCSLRDPCGSARVPKAGDTTPPDPRRRGHASATTRFLPPPPALRGAGAWSGAWETAAPARGGASASPSLRRRGRPKPVILPFGSRSSERFLAPAQVVHNPANLPREVLPTCLIRK